MVHTEALAATQQQDPHALGSNAEALPPVPEYLLLAGETPLAPATAPAETGWPAIPIFHPETSAARRLGQDTLRLARHAEAAQQVEAAYTRPSRPFEKAITHLEDRVARQRQKLDQERESGNDSLLRTVGRSFARSYKYEASRAEHLGARQTIWRTRAQRCQERGGILNTFFGWINKGFARYCGWKARSAARSRDYYAEGLTELGQ